MFSRRSLLLSSPAVMVLGSVLSATAQSPPSVADLAVAGPLGDKPVGNDDAKVTIIEYASLTCGHCARFHKDIWPALKAKYVDTGKARYILREFPLDPLATAGFMAARCAAEGKYHAVIDLLFQQQANWAFVEKPLGALVGILRQAGFTQESFESCLKRDDIYVAINDVKNRGSQKIGVTSTPTFFINGQKHTGALSLQEFDKILAPLLGE